MMLLVSNEVQPVPDDLSHSNPLPPSVKHLGDQVLIVFVGVVPPATDCLCEQRKSLVFGTLCDVLNLMGRESLLCHQAFQIMDVELMVKDLFDNRSALVDVLDGRHEVGLSLPSIKGMAGAPGETVVDHAELLPFVLFHTEGSNPEVGHVVKQALPPQSGEDRIHILG